MHGVLARSATPSSDWHYAVVAALHPAVRAPLRAVATARLSLRPLNREDADEMEALCARPGVLEFEYGRGLTRPESDAVLARQLRLWDECGFGGCAVHELGQAGLVGVVGLAVATVARDLLPPLTVGWRFSPTVCGRGYATEAASAVLEQAFTTMGVVGVGCVTDAENRRSVALARRLGMTVVGETAVPPDGNGTVTALLLQVTSDLWCARSDRGVSQEPPA